MQMASVEAGSMMARIGHVGVCVNGDDLICLPVTGIFIVRISLDVPAMDIPEDLWYTTWSPVSNLICERAGYAELLQGSHALRRQSIH
jgi:hypothetical protein